MVYGIDILRESGRYAGTGGERSLGGNPTGGCSRIFRGAGGVALVGGAKAMKQHVLILCTGNSARSQMAEGLLRNLAEDRFEVVSAGTRPGTVRPEAIQVMKEIGIDISGHRSKSVEEFAGREFDYVLTVCDHARDACPVFPGVSRRVHWSFEDPAAVDGSEETRLAAFRRIRNQIRDRFQEFLRRQH